MFLFIMLSVIILTAIFVAATVAGILGSVFLIVFGDLIVCVALIVGIIRFCKTRKSKNA